MLGRSSQRTCPLWWAPLVLERSWPSRGARASPAGGRGTRWAPWRTSYTWLVGRWRGARRPPLHEHRDFAHLQVLVRWVERVERRIQLGHSPWVCGPRLVQVRGRVPGAVRPEGVKQGWGAAAEGHGRPRSRQPQGVPHGQGPARPVGLTPLHPVPVEGRLRADEPPLDSVHDPVHRREGPRGPCSVQGTDSREGGLVDESSRTARRVTSCGSVRLMRLCHRVCYQAPDSRLLRLAAGPGVSRLIPPSARHAAAGSAKCGSGWGSGREHVRQGRKGRGVPQVHMDPQEGGARGARAFV